MRSYIDEREGQIEFFKAFRIDPSEVLVDNTDGVYNGNLLEFKLNISNLNRVLYQAIKYLSKLRIKGKSVPSKILLISLNEELCYVFNSQDYFDEIHEVYLGAASKDNDTFVARTTPQTIHYSSDNMLGVADLLDLLRTTSYMPIRIDDNCIVGWAERYYLENPNASKGDFLGDSDGKVKIIGEIRQPRVFKGLILPYEGQTNEKFKYLMDKLNDNLKKKDLGAFYTPKLYCEKGAELLREAIKRVPEGNDYIILDRCAGTGNLESVLTDEELSHCILSTYEYYEYKVLCERLADKVRYIVPPIEHEDTYDRGFVKNANALSQEYVENELIQKYIQDEKCTMILYENPPYAESNGTTKISSFKFNYVVEKMKEDINGKVSNDIANAFIWSAFKYYLRQPTDSYIIFSPIKYWKIQDLVNKKYLNGFILNRKHFHAATDFCVMAILWSNENDFKTNCIYLDSYDIKENVLVYEKNLCVKKVNSRFSDRYNDKRKFDTDIPSNIALGLNGLEVNNNNVKIRIKPFFNSSILGYLIAYSSGFENDGNVSGLFVAGRYDGNGFYLRKDNYLEKLPMFAASRYIRYVNHWTEKGRIMKSADGADKYFKDIEKGKLQQQLLKILLFCCVEMQNHMRTFKGSDGRFYRNEICLDTTNGETIASRDLTNLIVGEKEKALLNLWDKILQEAKKTKNYNPSLTYGLYQIKEELNTSYKDEFNKTVYDYPVLNGHIATLRTLVKAYFIEEIVPFLFEYEFLK